MMVYTMIAQSRPANTTAVSIYSPKASMQTEIKEIIVCNTSAASQDFRIFLDADGTTYDESTALFWDVSLKADGTMQIEAGWWMDNSSGNLAVRTDSANAFTFTVFGAENAR